MWYFVPLTMTGMIGVKFMLEAAGHALIRHKLDFDAYVSTGPPAISSATACWLAMSYPFIRDVDFFICNVPVLLPSSWNFNAATWTCCVGLFCSPWPSTRENFVTVVVAGSSPT